MRRERERKSQSALKKDDVSSKKAPRSPAFSQALTNARSYAKDPERLRQLFKEAVKKAPTIPREPFKDLWAYFQAMLRLIRAYYRREYRNVPLQNLVMIVGAIIYILNPFDLIPDWIAGLGFADDAVVLAFAVRQTRQTLDDFMTWEIRSRARPTS
ncbi:MAG TPA: YkvA family protein [Chthoniobacterales bacterium]|nr:YkvA family protein [Chthoniobacterales bacterium]